jgi:hypothetical protein
MKKILFVFLFLLNNLSYAEKLQYFNSYTQCVQVRGTMIGLGYKRNMNNINEYHKDNKTITFSCVYHNNAWSISQMVTRDETDKVTAINKAKSFGL